MKDPIKSLTSKLDFKTSGCWEWQGFMVKGKYPKAWLAGKWVNVQRLFYEAYFGEKVDRYRQPLHRCKNMRCCNPDHIEYGSRMDHFKLYEKEKYANNPLKQKGEDSNLAKLKKVDVDYIRSLYAKGLRQVEIAIMFDVTRQCINYIVNNINWSSDAKLK